jgi:hypothetical protein
MRNPVRDLFIEVSFDKFLTFYYSEHRSRLVFKYFTIAPSNLVEIPIKKHCFGFAFVSMRIQMISIHGLPSRKKHCFLLF